MGTAGTRTSAAKTSQEVIELGINEEGRRFIDAHWHRVAAALPLLDSQTKLAYDELSAWLRNVTEQTGIPRQSEFFLVSWLLACNFLHVLEHELALSSHPRKEEGEYWFKQIVQRAEITGLWHLQFAEDGDGTAGIMGDTGGGKQEGEI